jgi:hypothetical protein
MASAGACTLRLKLFLTSCGCLEESEALTRKVKLPVCVGVPLRVPLDERLSPGGKEAAAVHV